MSSLTCICAETFTLRRIILQRQMKCFRQAAANYATCVKFAGGVVLQAGFFV